MRTLLMVLMIAGLMSTVGVYAAGFTTTPGTKTVSGTASGGVTVGQSTTTAATTVSWAFDSAGLINGAKVDWTPAADGDYDIIVTVGGTTGTLNIPTSGAVARSGLDTVTISPAVLASAVSSAEVVIEQN